METEATETVVPVSKESSKSCLITIGLLLLLATGVLSVWGCLIAFKDPTVPTFAVKSAFLNPQIISSKLVAELDIVFNVSNHNDWHKAFYNTLSITLNSNINNQTNNIILASTSLKPFSQKKGSDDPVIKEAQLNINDVRFSNRTTVEFEIVLSGIVELKSIVKSKNKSLNVVCKPLSMRYNPASSNWVLVHGLTCE